MHLVRARIVGLDRLERARARPPGRVPRSALPWRDSESSSSEVKWSPAVGAATLPSCSRVDRLIAGLVGSVGIARDVGRQRQLAEPVDGLLRRGRRRSGPGDCRRRGPPRSRSGVGAEHDPLARLQRAAGLAHRDPGAVGAGMDQQDLGRRSRRAGAEQARVPHPRGVEDEEVPAGISEGSWVKNESTRTDRPTAR